MSQLLLWCNLELVIVRFPTRLPYSASDRPCVVGSPLSTVDHQLVARNRFHIFSFRIFYFYIFLGDWNPEHLRSSLICCQLIFNLTFSKAIGSQSLSNQTNGGHHETSFWIVSRKMLAARQLPCSEICLNDGVDGLPLGSRWKHPGCFTDWLWC
jgi:hypothetical protein